MDQETAITDVVFNGRNKKVKRLTEGRVYRVLAHDDKFAWVENDVGRTRPYSWGNFRVWNLGEFADIQTAEDRIRFDRADIFDRLDELSPRVGGPASSPAEPSKPAFSIWSRETWPRWFQLVASAPGLSLILFLVLTAIVLSQI